MQGKQTDGFISRRIKSFGHAFSGVAIFFKETTHAKVHGVAALTVLAAAFYCNVTLIEWCLLLIAIGLVLGLEALNSALEYVVDLVSPEFHPLAKKAKDVAASAVLIASILAAAVGIIILWPYIKALLF